MKTSSDWVMEELFRLRLKGYDHDGAGGLPLRADVADLVATVYDLAFTDKMPDPIVSLNGNGTLDVEYDGDSGRKLFLCYQCAGVVTYIRAFEDDQTVIEGTIRLNFNTYGGKFDPDDFLELTGLFDWLASE